MKIAVLISGGVDSSVALQLLKNQGHQVEAFYLKIWLEDELAYLGSCPWEDDVRYCREVCEKLNVPLHIVSLQDEYWSEVVSYTIAEVKAGRTPSPDILCNQRIKFNHFLKKIDPSFEKVASGHYANVEHDGKSWVLKRAKDPIKDQTYFLSHLNQEQLSRIMFPIGHLLKSEVRALAHEFDLPNQGRKDSQGICFLGKIKFSEFVRHHLGDNPGDFIEYETGDVIGRHDGYWYYTIGQRKGMGLSGGPWFVVYKDIDKNIVYISKEYYSPEKQRDTFEVADVHWISREAPEKKDLQVKIRHGELAYDCVFEFTNRNSGIVTISGNDQGFAPGQFAVFYDQDVCLGCGIIAESTVVAKHYED
jgi:tRNA-specific 2-thiouridylase